MITESELELIGQRLELASETPSGLKWKRTAGVSVHRRGKMAGTFNRRGGKWRVVVKGQRYSCAQIILLLNDIKPKDGETIAYHLDGDSKNNKISNLQWQANGYRSSANRRVPFRYVYLHTSGKYRATYPKNEKTIYVGTFDSPEEAHAQALAHIKANP